MMAKFTVAVAVYVDLHDHRPPAGPQHPGRSNAKDPAAIMTAVDSPKRYSSLQQPKPSAKEAPVRRVRELLPRVCTPTAHTLSSPSTRPVGPHGKPRGRRRPSTP